MRIDEARTETRSVGLGNEDFSERAGLVCLETDKGRTGRTTRVRTLFSLLGLGGNGSHWNSIRETTTSAG